MKKSNLTPREIVKRCIEFRDPPRIGMHFSVNPIEGKTWPFTDFAGVSFQPDPDFVPIAQDFGEWGYKMETLDPTSMGEVKDPPLGESWKQLESYKFPDFRSPVRYAHLREEVENFHAQGRYVYGNIPSLMLLPINLRGMENWFMDHVLEKENLCLLLDRIVETRLAIIAHYADAGVDGAITYDDMGTNDRTLVSPNMFREIYLPRYRRTNDALHERNMHLLHHCCGQVQEYMNMLIEGGCDVIQLDQPLLMGIDWLGENYGGKICFWNCVDIQKTIPRNDLEAIDDEAHRQVWRLGNYGGGFMVKAYQQPEAIRMTIEQSEAQYRAFRKYGNYPITWEQ